MRVLITGIAGLLGANLSRHLMKNHEVFGVDDLSGGYTDNIPDVPFHRVDLKHGPLAEAVIAEFRPEVIYHFAAYAAEGLSPFIRRYNYENNVIASMNVVNGAVNYDVRKIVFSSSMAVYGKGTSPFHEYDPVFPVDPYGVAKYAVELDLANAKEMFGLDYTIVRPHNIIGKYQNIWDKYRNVIGIWIRQALNGEPISIFGDGTQVRAFSDVGFYMDPLEKLLTECSQETINLGADRHYTINEASDVVVEVAKEFGIDAKKIHHEARKEVHTAYCDHKKAKRLLGFEDHTDLKKTVREMFAWAQTRPNYALRHMPVEIEKGLYSFWNGHSPTVQRAA